MSTEKNPTTGLVVELFGPTVEYLTLPDDQRNVSSEPVVSLIITTKRLGHFFQETGRPLADAAQPPTPEGLARFAAVSARYGYWNGTPEENAAVGIELSF
jgi:hypothetical protein